MVLGASESFVEGLRINIAKQASQIEGVTLSSKQAVDLATQLSNTTGADLSESGIREAVMRYVKRHGEGTAEATDVGIVMEAAEATPTPESGDVGKELVAFENVNVSNEALRTVSTGDPERTARQAELDKKAGSGKTLVGISETLTGEKQASGTTAELVGEGASAGATANITGDSGDRQVGPGADIDIVGDGQAGSDSDGEVTVTSGGSNRGNLVVIALVLGGAALVWGWLYD